MAYTTCAKCGGAIRKDSKSPSGWIHEGGSDHFFGHEATPAASASVPWTHRFSKPRK